MDVSAKIPVILKFLFFCDFTPFLELDAEIGSQINPLFVPPFVIEFIVH
jgi:hypothetical protein